MGSDAGPGPSSSASGAGGEVSDPIGEVADAGASHEEVLGRLIERARDAVAEQARLNRMVHAQHTLTGEIRLPELLERVVRAAQELTGARYAALGVRGREGTFAEFVHLGDPPGVAEAIGRPPRGLGVLGALLEDPRPLRLADLSEDPRACGFPPGHPPMRSFLGVPVRVRDEVYGNLYLTEHPDGQFSDADEDMVISLARSAADVIDTARRFSAVVAREQWLLSATALVGQVLNGRIEELLQAIAERARTASNAPAAGVLLRDQDTLRMQSIAGDGLALGSEVDISSTPFDTVISDNRAILIETPDRLRGLDRLLADGHAIGAAVLAPMDSGNARVGVLVLIRPTGSARFSDDDTALAAEFAHHAGAAVELARAMEDHSAAAVQAERERMAMELHDRVIGQLFTVGLSLHSAAALAGPGSTVEARIGASVAVLDATIAQIRNTIFGLRALHPIDEPNLRQHLAEVVLEVADGAAVSPIVEFEGQSHASLTAEAVEDIGTVLRTLLEFLRDTGSTQPRIVVRASTHDLILEIHSRATTTLPAEIIDQARALAERNGGSFHVGTTDPSGIHLRWSIPNS